MDSHREALLTRLRCFGRAVKNVGKFHIIPEKEMA